jgi:hypothetical protein
VYRFPTSFPENARWNAERQAVEFGVGEYRGVVRVPRRVIQGLLPERPTPASGVLRSYYRQRTLREQRRAETAPKAR